MARANHFLTDLRRQLARLDDEGLTALASAGLLRRARKDLETQQPEVVSADDSVKVRLAQHEVTLDARGPTHARCTCPSKTTCQHVLAACLFLKSLPDEAGAPEAAVDAPDQLVLHNALLAITLTSLVRFAGKPAIREALAAVESDEPAQLSFDRALVIRLARPGIEFRYVGGGPESLITDFRGRSGKKLAAQAILSVQRAHGMQHTLPGEAQVAGEDHPEEVQELRTAVLRKVARLLRECVDVGLAHISDTLLERLAALATVAEGARLHRLSLTLNRLADQVDLILERHARADPAAFLAELASTFALTQALRDPASWQRVELVGEARSSYEEQATLDLYCAGAYSWQTGSGYWGLTVLLWSAALRRWFTHSDSRPLGTLGFSPGEAYRTGGPWRGCASPAAIMGQRVVLDKASANRAGRLSGSTSTAAEVMATTVPDFAGATFTSWAALREHARTTIEGIGLAESNPAAEFVVLCPRRFFAHGFAGTSQTLVWPIEDENGEQLQLRLEYSDISAAAVERLDALEPESGMRVIAQLNWSSGTLTARPLTLLRTAGERVVDNIFLDAAPALGAGRVLLGKLRAALASLPSGGGTQAPVHPMHGTGRMLNELNALLLSIAERGATSHTGLAETFATTVRKLHDSGLTLIDPASSLDAAAVLRARYLSQVAQECLERS
ncbi:MAG TPA: SWIM zinc finger family protein [Steroidobacteraceae bacterium]|nr:SWIM zinc finger family protein [Steroidobacteraceae bacterium]